VPVDKVSDYCGVSIQIIKKGLRPPNPRRLRRRPWFKQPAGPERNGYATERGEMNGNEARQRGTKVK
jgi:hypothetical protein